MTLPQMNNEEMNTSEVLPKKKVTRAKKSSTQSVIPIKLDCLNDSERACDQAVNDLYAKWTGIQIAESIKRYRRRLEMEQTAQEEQRLLEELLAKRS
jgi:hypothetical protein